MLKINQSSILKLSVLTLTLSCSYSYAQFPKPEVPEYMKALPVQTWQDTESGRFAHSLQYEDKLAKPVPYQFTQGKDYRQESIGYFEHLCKTEGKDYIYKTVSGIDTIAQLRSFEIPEDKTNNPDWGPMAYKFHPYALEAPMFFNESLAGLDKNSFNAIRGSYAPGYKNYEVVFNNKETYNYQYDYDLSKNLKIKNPNIDKKEKGYLVSKKEKTSKIIARYGFTWKGFNRPEDRDFGIAGGDFIILDIEKNEIIGVQRTFIKASIQRNSPSGINWDGVGCFEQYKNSDVYREISFDNKNFQEKAKMINYSSPEMLMFPSFLRKVIVKDIYEK